ncbi:MAG: tetratricopeptide repeat protein [Burkholderiaceae bacterium]|nr:tetratricopeptide repeat protein [Burkholderiaceae bacterium]
MAATTYLFTDIEGSTRLWEQQPERMRLALARHDELARRVVVEHRGTVVKMTGDGVHAAFDDAADAVAAALALQLHLADWAQRADLMPLAVRCGLHCGSDERRAGDFFGPAVNRAARIMGAAHGGQVLLSQAVAERVRDRLPAGASLRELGTVRLRDLARPERLLQLVHPRLRRDFPPLRSLEATPNNLPQQVNSFIGRERELADVRALLAQHRLVTLLGMGGLGKSRLSVQLAAELLDEYPDGVWLVEFAPLADPQLVPQAVASVLGVKEESGGTVLDALLRFVRDRALLLVLDNCEHLVQACAHLAKTLLAAGGGVKLLASSRDALRVAGEAVYALPPLPVPASEVGGVGALAASEAVRLFVDRATAVQPAFRLDERNAAAVARICAQLDGIPLALELAAARMRVLSAEAIAARLHERFRLLVTGDRTVLPRQRTLRALIDWSYDLLTAAERTLFSRLAVFSGGCTLEAAEAVCAGDGIAAQEVLDLLGQLVEKSLVIADLDQGRYRMLETVRQYALEKLQASGAERATRDRHLAFYLQLAETARSELVGPQQATWLDRLDRELDNLLAAHAWCAQADGGGEAGLRLVMSVKFYFLSRGLLALGERFAVEALQRPCTHDVLRSRGLAAAGQFLFYRGLYQEAQRFLLESLQLARQAGDLERIVGALQPLGMACLGEGDIASARLYLEEAAEMAEQINSSRARAGTINALVQLRRVEGRFDDAERLCGRTLDIARQLGDQDAVAINLLNLAMIDLGRGNIDRVRDILIEVIEIARALRSLPINQSILEVGSAFALSMESAARSARYLGASQGLAKRTGFHRDPADEAFVAAVVRSARAQLGDTAYADAETAGAALQPEEAIAELEGWLRGIRLSGA